MQLAKSPRSWKLILGLGQQTLPVPILDPKFGDLPLIELTIDYGVLRRCAICGRLIGIKITLVNATVNNTRFEMVQKLKGWLGKRIAVLLIDNSPFSRVKIGVLRTAFV